MEVLNKYIWNGYVNFCRKDEENEAQSFLFGGQIITSFKTKLITLNWLLPSHHVHEIYPGHSVGNNPLRYLAFQSHGECLTHLPLCWKLYPLYQPMVPLKNVSSLQTHLGPPPPTDPALCWGLWGEEGGQLVAQVTETKSWEWICWCNGAARKCDVGVGLWWERRESL